MGTCYLYNGNLHAWKGSLYALAVVSFPGRWWHHNDLNFGINSYNNQ